MLVLSRKANELIEIGHNIRVKVVRIDGRQVRLGIEAPRNIAIRRPEATARFKRQPDAAIVPAESPRRVLIVDDCPEDREIYRRLLRPQNESDTSEHFEISETDCGEDGLELCRAERPDCVLLDYCLPDLDGLEFLEELREVGGMSVPVVMLTGHGDESIAVRAMKSGARDYLPKHELTRDRLRESLAQVFGPFDEVCCM